MAKTINHETFIAIFEAYPPQLQLQVFEKLKTIMDDKEAERKKLSADYQIIQNGK